ncbi:MAG: hypothetical protein AAF713_01030 [Pseudomonadota bacterium]
MAALSGCGTTLTITVSLIAETVESRLGPTTFGEAWLTGVGRLDLTRAAGVEGNADLTVDPQGANTRIDLGAETILLLETASDQIDASDFLI